MKFKFVLLAIFLVNIIFSCDQKQQERVKVAKVYDQILYKSDLEGVVPQGVSDEDSTERVQQYVDNWIKDKILLYTAENLLPENKKNVERQLEKYRNSLLIYAYEKELISQKLDTVVKINEIEAYYQSHKKEFQLKDYLVKVLYLKAKKGAPELWKVDRWCRTINNKNLVELENYSQKHSVNFYYDEDNWLFFDDLLKEIPLRVDRNENYILKRKYTKFYEGDYVYYLNIFDYRLKNAVSPLEIEKDNIKSIIINKRIIDLRKEMRKKLIDEAHSNKKVERY